MAKTILIVEDEHDLLDLYKLKFEDKKFNVLTASSAEEAKDILNKDIPDVVLLDIVLPKASGFDLLKDIKSDNKFKKIPVIILSNLGQQLDVEQGYKYKAEMYLTKSSYTPEDVYKKVKEVLKQKK